MPRQRLRVRPLIGALRHLHRSSMHCVIVPPVFELVSYPPAHFKVVGRRHRDVASIKQTVNVAAKEKTVRRFVHPLLCVRRDVRRIQRRERPLAGYSTASLIIISHYYAKSPLSQTWPDQARLAPALRDWSATGKRLGRRF